jgi:hypothetical protein
MQLWRGSYSENFKKSRPVMVRMRGASSSKSVGRLLDPTTSSAVSSSSRSRSGWRRGESGRISKLFSFGRVSPSLRRELCAIRAPQSFGRGCLAEQDIRNTGWGVAADPCGGRYKTSTKNNSCCSRRFLDLGTSLNLLPDGRPPQVCNTNLQTNVPMFRKQCILLVPESESKVFLGFIR